jgi:c-di-GMP-binding flagellar brake protein YcgR
MALERQSNAADQISGDRRSDKRYDIQLDLRWKLIRRKRVLETGIGRTVDLSSGGIMFDAGRPLPAGLNVELSVSWPAMLHNTAAMQLVITGKIVRSDRQYVAVESTQHEFRTVATVSDRSQAMAVAPGGSRGVGGWGVTTGGGNRGPGARV